MNLISDLATKCPKKKILVDTNLLILLLIGYYDKDQIVKYKRTNMYCLEDFEILTSFLSHFIVITTPNILTEVTDLCKSFNSQTHHEFFGSLGSIIKEHFEIYVASNSLMRSTSFIKFGLTDAGIHTLNENGYIVLTDDFPLFGFLISQGLTAINFNHIRSQYVF